MTNDTNTTQRGWWPWVLAGLGTVLVPPLGLSTIALYLVAKRLNLNALWLTLVTPAAFALIYGAQGIGFDLDAWIDAWPPQDTSLSGVLLAGIQSGIVMLVWAGPLAAAALWASRRWETPGMGKGLAKIKTALAPKPVPALASVAATAASVNPAPVAEPVSAPSPARPPDEIRLGTDTANGQTTGVYLDELGQHALLLGATGSGKTTTLLKITDGAAALGIPVVAIDLKGSRGFGDRLRQTANRRGRGFVHWSLSGNTHWNPLARGDASELKDKLVGMEAWSEPHYKRAAERYLQTVFTVLDALGETPSLKRVVELMDTRALNATLRDVPKDLADRVGVYLDQLAHSNDQRSAIAGLSTRLALLADSTAGDLLASPTDPDAKVIDIGDRIRAGEVCLFSLDSLRWPELAPQVAGLVIQDLKTVASEMLANDDGHRALLAIDEFSALDGDQLLGLLARAREAGIGVLLSTQELADLARVAPTFASQVIANTNVKLIHRQEVPDSVELLAGTIGTYQTWEHTFAEHDPIAETLAGQVSTVIGTRREIDKYTVHPNTFKNLGIGEAVLSIKAPEAAVGVISVDAGNDTAPTTPMIRSLPPPTRAPLDYQAPTIFTALGDITDHVSKNGIGAFFGAGQK